MQINVKGLTPLLQVFDMPTSIHFYRDILGFEIVSTSSPQNYFWAMLKLGPATLMLNTAYEDDKRPPTPDPQRIAAHEDTTLYFGCEDLEELYAYLREKGVVAQPPKVAPYGMKQLYVKDPDGFSLCFQHAVK